jgi:hypothetical protein
MVVALERRADEVLAPDPPGARGQGRGLTERHQERGVLHPRGPVLMLAHAAKQDGIQADELTQRREGGGGVGGPHLGREFGFRQGQHACLPHHQHLRAVGMHHHPPDPAAPFEVAHGRTSFQQ